jgi:tetratricopeptide (TPR) repeat protein
MIKRLNLFLGPERVRALFLLLAVTGLLSLILNAVEAEWVTTVQTLLVLVFIIGAGVIVFTRLDSFDRGRYLGLLAPSLGAVVLGLTVLPQFLLPLLGGAAGWVIAGLFLFNPRGPMQYQQAVKHLRKNEYEQAVKVMDGLIKEESQNPNHYRFRAEILRLWGKLDRAKRDYQKMTELDPESAVGFNGLAEVYLQGGEYQNAREAGLKAYELAPDEWVASYNLGMIEDRLRESQAAVEHLREALQAKVPDARHRLLIYLYLMRAYVRMGDVDAARVELAQLKKQQAGLREWQTILSSEQAETLRKVIEQDVQTAAALIEGSLDVAGLADGGNR